MQFIRQHRMSPALVQEKEDDEWWAPQVWIQHVSLQMNCCKQKKKMMMYHRVMLRSCCLSEMSERVIHLPCARPGKKNKHMFVWYLSTFPVVSHCPTTTQHRAKDARLPLLLINFRARKLTASAFQNCWYDLSRHIMLFTPSLPLSVRSSFHMPWMQRTAPKHEKHTSRHFTPGRACSRSSWMCCRGVCWCY